MLSAWSAKRVLIVVKTYPTPANKGIEVSCTAGVTREGDWIRLFPVPFRFLEEEQKFARYQWIDAQVRHARNDPRPESHNLNDASLQIAKVPRVQSWGAREQILAPLRKPSLCQIERERQEFGSPTLGLFRPARIKSLRISEANPPNWTPRELAILNRPRLDLGIGSEPKRQLEKIPFEFRYEFACADHECKGHALLCLDWEMAQSYRAWRRTYRSEWQKKFRERYERDMIERNDTSFYVGTMHQHPNRWIIVGLFYPPKPIQSGHPTLF